MGLKDIQNKKNTTGGGGDGGGGIVVKRERIKEELKGKEQSFRDAA